MAIPPGTAERLHDRQETVRVLCIFTTYGPMALSVILFVTVAMVVIGLFQNDNDTAALAVSIILTPTVGLMWTFRHLVTRLLDDLDICLDHEDADSPRP